MSTLLTSPMVDDEMEHANREKLDREQARDILEWYDELYAYRATWDRLYQEVRELIRPNAEDFTKTISWALSRKQRIYDDWPTHCLQNLSAGLQSTLVNPTTKWFNLTTSDEPTDERPEVAGYLQSVTQKIYDSIYHPKAGFNLATQEMFTDWPSFGTCVVMFLENDDHLMFRALPLAECYLSEDHNGIVDTVFRKFTLSKKAAIKRFPNLPEELKRDNSKKEEQINFIHAVFPVDSTIPYQSVYIHKDSEKIVERGVFHEFPYCCVRWTKPPSEVYGRGPGTDSLQQVRLLNEKQRILLQTDQLVSAPPIISEDDGVLSSIVLQPWGNIRIRPGSQYPKPLELTGNLSASREMLQDLKNSISLAYYNDLFSSTDYGNRERVTTQEVQVDQSTKLQRIAPIVGRLEIEFLAPIIKRVYSFLVRKGQIPPQPMAMKGKKMTIEYLSPASQALRATKAQNTLKFVQTILPFIQYDQSLLDAVDLDRVMSDMAFAFDIDIKALRSQAQIAHIKDQRQQAAQAQQASQQTEAVSNSIKNVAQATQANPTLNGLLPQQ